MITNFERLIYNNFLATRKKIKNQPFKLRQDFTKLDDTTILQLKKLETFFTNNRSVNIEIFFTAPYIIYSKDDFFDLQFFLTRKALTCYTLYCKKLETAEPDTEENIEKASECVRNIYKYCRENHLTLAEYNSHIIGKMPGVLSHLKEHKINFYTLHGLNNRQIHTIEKELVEFIIPNFYNTFYITQQNFIKSVKLKKFFKRSLEIIEKQLLKTTNSNIT
jgi:hypothetical protein